jgi:hypothetical protein
MQQNPMVWVGLIQPYLLMTIIAVPTKISVRFDLDALDRRPSRGLGP